MISSRAGRRLRTVRSDTIRRCWPRPAFGSPSTAGLISRRARCGTVPPRTRGRPHRGRRRRSGSETCRRVAGLSWPWSASSGLPRSVERIGGGALCSGTPGPPPCSRPGSASPWRTGTGAARAGSRCGSETGTMSLHQRCYEAMPVCRSWGEVADAAGLPEHEGDTPYRRGCRARVCARHYAAVRGLAFPPEGSRIRGRGRPRSLARARRAYELRAGAARTWRSIAREVGYSTANHGRTALEMARHYASGAGLPWPPGQSHQRSQGVSSGAASRPDERATAI